MLRRAVRAGLINDPSRGPAASRPRERNPAANLFLLQLSERGLNCLNQRLILDLLSESQAFAPESLRLCVVAARAGHAPQTAQRQRHAALAAQFAMNIQAFGQQRFRLVDLSQFAQRAAENVQSRANAPGKVQFPKESEALPGRR